jgi:DedD protein
MKTMAANMTNENGPERQIGDGDLKRRLTIRVAVAGAAIVALLGGLALMDNLNAPTPAQQIAAAPPAGEANTPPAGGVAAEEKSQEPAVPAVTEEQPQVPAAEPELSAAPTSSGMPSKPEHAERPLTKPAEARLAMLKPGQPAMLLKPAEPAGELARALHAGTSASRPLTPGGFLLQLGVFNSTANAEELRAKLELNGFPTQIEARVHVGPFASRLEAEQARDKLKRLGMEPGVTLAVKK